MRYAMLITGLATCLLAAIVFAAPDPDAVAGQWWSDGRESRIEIYKKGDQYWGRLAWLEEPNYPEGDPEAGQPKHDRKNPDAARRLDPLLGLDILRHFSFDGSETWTGGSIYNPEDGKTYTSKLRLRDEKTLDVRGYVGIPLFGKSTVWKRVEKEDKSPEPDPATR